MSFLTGRRQDKEQIQALKEQITMGEGQLFVKHMQTENQELRKQLATLREERDQYKVKAEVLTRQMEMLNNIRVGLKSQIEGLQSEVDDLRGTVKSQHDDIVRYTTKLERQRAPDGKYKENNDISYEDKLRMCYWGKVKGKTDEEIGAQLGLAANSVAMYKKRFGDKKITLRNRDGSQTVYATVKEFNPETYLLDRKGEEAQIPLPKRYRDVTE